MFQTRVIPDRIAGYIVTGIEKPKNKKPNNQALSKIVFPETLRWIEKEAFKNCSSLESLELSESLLIIYESAFENCVSLTEVRIPKGTTTLLDSAFGGCISLENAYIPNTVNCMGYLVFNTGKNLHIYIEHESVPKWTKGWASKWQYGATVETGYTGYSE